MSESNSNPPVGSPVSPTSTPATAAADSTDLTAACAALQRETFNLKLILLVVTLAVAAFFWREASYQKFEVAQMQPQAMQASQVMEALAKQQSSIPKALEQMQAIVNRLSEYARLHPDYAQVLAKYGVQVQPVGSAPATPAARPAAAPAAAPAPPKR
jgi:hypothetical protein